MTKMQAYRYCQDHGAGFIANGVLCQHSDAARRLKAMAQIIGADHDVTLPSFSMAYDCVLVDGYAVKWSDIYETAKKLVAEYLAGKF